MPPAKIVDGNFSKLKEKLRELFQLDRGDLDFGLYRIMAHKSAEVDAFLENHLLPQVAQALGSIAVADSGAAQKELDDAIAQAKKLGGIDPEQTDVVKNARVKLAAAKTDQQTEADTYNHLYNFFSRYYNEGDFMSLRRYKGAGKEPFAIPYNGEEVKLHWANADQYYIKTTENYSSYIFIPGDDKLRVRFEIAKADNEKDNIKEANGKQRFFVLSKGFIDEQKNQLIVRFEHRPLTEGEKKKHPQNGVRRQASINREAGRRILGKLDKLKGNWLRPLSALCPTEADPERTLLDKHIAVYTAKNSFDYFIHKDLGGFLRRELDQFLKSEVLSIDNLEIADDPAVLWRNLAQMKAIKLVGGKIIDFLAQLENFQKQLWLKKKFVLETNYCVTADKIPAALHAEIIANKAQLQEWKTLFSFAAPKNGKAFLKHNPHLIIDTRHFNRAFTDKLLAALSEAGPIEEQMNGLLVHGENFQALNLLQEKYRGQMKCVYIDPPYNTPSSEIMYKNNYKHSSWLTLLKNRMELGKKFLSGDGINMTTIDYEEMFNLGHLNNSVFGVENRLGIITIYINPKGRQHEKFFSASTEYMFVYAKDQKNAAFPGVVIDPDKMNEFNLEDKKGKYRLDPFARIRSNTKRELKPKFWYPIYVSSDFQDISLSHKPGYLAVYPVDDGGNEYSWKVVEKSFRENLKKSLYVAKGSKGKITIYNKFYESQVLQNIWTHKKYFPEFHGTNLLKDIFGGNVFTYPKSVFAVSDSIKITSSNGDFILDYFAGSGTTGHAVINLNREDGGDRKYILVEVGQHFDDVLLPRMKKVAYCDKWKDGKPNGGDGISQLFKYVRLESYEDTLDSLAVKPRQALFTQEKSKAIVEDYQLRYVLGEETADSASLLGRDFTDPNEYTLSVVRDGARRDVKVDLAETFNFLLGLNPGGHRRIDGVLAITGTTRKGGNCLILWRNLNKMGASKLDKWFSKHRKAFGDNLNTIYVNGDHTLNALRKQGDKWEAVTIEPVFRRLMFSGVE